MKNFDVIVVGSGIAGLNFALKSAEKSYRVLVITKSKIDDTGTRLAQGGIAAAIADYDHYKQHFNDTLEAGAFHNDKKAVTYLVKHGKEAIERLLEVGVKFNKKDGQLLLTREGGHRQRRVAFVADYTGLAIEEALVASVHKNKRITVLENTFVAELLIKNKKCYGVQILRDKKFENIFAKVTALATGGVGQIFEHTTNPGISTGDGLALAFRAGCKFKDLEFIQFHPTVFKFRGQTSFLISEAVRGEGAFLLNSKGKRFMVGKHPLAELAPRDIVARAIFEEEKNGSGFLDFRHKTTDYLQNRFPQIYKELAKSGFKMKKDLIPISPAAHYLCGGIKVDLKGKTSVKNLYAFGETACTGVHGANRLASNSLLEAIVFTNNVPKVNHSAFANRHSEFISESNHEILKPPQGGAQQVQDDATTTQKHQLAALRTNLQKTMWRNVGIVRNSTDLKKALKFAQSLLKKIHNAQTKESLELRNMAHAALLITKAALARKKSLGCHFTTI
ncbi:L-aspartate oxidase [Candidatus Peregrinibacteria bacterium]|nr:L-aspartate oxidase [Candidatus Peregrinibacteria bacterium]